MWNVVLLVLCFLAALAGSSCTYSQVSKTGGKEKDNNETGEITIQYSPYGGTAYIKRNSITSSVFHEKLLDSIRHTLKVTNKSDSDVSSEVENRNVTGVDHKNVTVREIPQGTEGEATNNTTDVQTLDNREGKFLKNLLPSFSAVKAKAVEFGMFGYALLTIVALKTLFLGKFALFYAIADWWKKRNRSSHSNYKRPLYYYMKQPSHRNVIYRRPNPYYLQGMIKYELPKEQQETMGPVWHPYSMDSGYYVAEQPGSSYYATDPYAPATNHQYNNAQPTTQAQGGYEITESSSEENGTAQLSTPYQTDGSQTTAPYYKGTPYVEENYYQQADGSGLRNIYIRPPMKGGLHVINPPKILTQNRRGSNDGSKVLHFKLIPVQWPHKHYE